MRIETLRKYFNRLGDENEAETTLLVFVNQAIAFFNIENNLVIPLFPVDDDIALNRFSHPIIDETFWLGVIIPYALGLHSKFYYKDLIVAGDYERTSKEVMARFLTTNNTFKSTWRDRKGNNIIRRADYARRINVRETSGSVFDKKGIYNQLSTTDTQIKDTIDINVIVIDADAALTNPFERKITLRIKTKHTLDSTIPPLSIVKIDDEIKLQQALNMIIPDTRYTMLNSIGQAVLAVSQPSTYLVKSTDMSDEMLKYLDANKQNYVCYEVMFEKDFTFN